MKLTIFGQHPIPQGGFNGVMSLFEAIYFSRLGYDVTLAIPFKDKDEYQELLQRNKIQSLNNLNKFNGRFEITPIFPDGENFNQCDVLIYQSYNQSHWQMFWGMCCKRSRLRTKNFPKFVTSPYDLNLGHVIGQFSQFHVVACALKEDVDMLDSDPNFKKQFQDSYAYVPRGASAEMLHPGYKAGLPPTIGLDMPNNEGVDAVKQYLEALERLRGDFPTLRVLTLGRELMGAEKIPYGRFDHIYENFFNNIHAYLSINYEHSPSHLNARVQKEVYDWRKKAIYEVQNIEAQMSGAVLVGHRDNLISELYSPGISGFNYRDYDNSENIYQLLKYIIQNRICLGNEARKFALKNFEWGNAIGKWSEAIQRKMQTLK